MRKGDVDSLYDFTLNSWFAFCPSAFLSGNSGELRDDGCYGRVGLVFLFSDGVSSYPSFSSSSSSFVVKRFYAGLRYIPSTIHFFQVLSHISQLYSNLETFSYLHFFKVSNVISVD